MYPASHYRERASQAERLKAAALDKATKQVLAQLANDFIEMAEDIEIGAIVVRHQDLLSEGQRAAAANEDRTRSVRHSGSDH